MAVPLDAEAGDQRDRRDDRLAEVVTAPAGDRDNHG